METIKLKDPAIVEPVAPPKVTADTHAVASPVTTAEENRKTAGQRNINLIWETTQALIALSVTGALIYTNIKGIRAESLDTAFVLITAVYFVRMNHIKVGGIGGTDSR